VPFTGRQSSAEPKRRPSYDPRGARAQPYATLIVLGAKRIETRSWATYHRGVLAIHASAGRSTEERALYGREPFSSVLGAAGAALARGAVLGLVEVTGCYPIDDDGALRTGPRQTTVVEEPERAFGHYAAGRFGWVLANPRPLPRPIACRGALGLWRVPTVVAEEVAAQLGIDPEARQPRLL
jgi:hypothetical protein